jgi:hypothetical protein
MNASGNSNNLPTTTSPKDLASSPNQEHDHVLGHVPKQKKRRMKLRFPEKKIEKVDEKRLNTERRLMNEVPNHIPDVALGARGSPKITEEHLTIVETALSKGFPYSMIADLLGIAKSTLSMFLSARPHITERLKKAEALHITRALEVIDRAAQKGTWQAAAWRIERRAQEHFGQQARVQVGGSIANVHFSAADAALLVNANKIKYAGKSGSKVVSEGKSIQDSLCDL